MLTRNSRGVAEAGYLGRAPELGPAPLAPTGMDYRVYMLILALFIAVFMVIGYFVLTASIRAHERRRRMLDSRWRNRQAWDAENAGLGQH